MPDTVRKGVGDVMAAGLRSRCFAMRHLGQPDVMLLQILILTTSILSHAHVYHNWQAFQVEQNALLLSIRTAMSKLNTSLYRNYLLITALAGDK